jgi:hypothetical protein
LVVEHWSVQRQKSVQRSLRLAQLLVTALNFPHFPFSPVFLLFRSTQHAARSTGFFRPFFPLFSFLFPLALARPSVLSPRPYALSPEGIILAVIFPAFPKANGCVYATFMAILMP